MRFRLVLAAFLALVLASPVEASTCDITEYPASGTLTAERLNQRVRQTEACINGQIGNSNLLSTEPIAASNLQTPNAIQSQAWTIGLTGAAAPADITASTDMVVWRVPVTSTVIGWSVKLQGCTGCSVTAVLQKDSSTISTLAAITVTTTQTSFALSSSVTNAQDLNIDISGTITGVKAIDIVVYEKSPLQT